MFNQPVDSRLTEWLDHRRQLDQSEDPLQAVWDFWQSAPFTPHNKNIDPYHQKSWPTPWEIIEYNRYDDFTKSLMIAWTLKLSNRFKDSKIELKMFIDSAKTRQYNLIYVDDSWVINYNDNGPVKIDGVPDSLRLENLVEVSASR